MKALTITRRELGWTVAIGVLLLFGGNGSVVLAEHAGLPSGVASLIVASIPLNIAVFTLATGQRLPLRTAIGVLIGFAGLVILILPRTGGGVPLGPALLVGAGAFSWALGSFLSPRVRLPKDPFVSTAYQMMFGGLALALTSVIQGENERLSEGSLGSWLALGYLIVAGSLCAFTAYVWLLHHASISLVATYAYANPVIAVLLGAMFAGEKITGPILLGGAIVIIGVALVVSREANGRNSSRSAEPTKAGGAGDP